MTGSRQLDETIAGRYRLERLLAHSDTCEVFSAFDSAKDVRVALKRMLSPTQPLDFMREYHALSELRDPHIITVCDYGVDRALPYYTMEPWDGQDLSELSPVPYRTACRYLRDVAASLALLHARRLLHRDLSPRNVRLMSDGRCKLLDFGALLPFGVAQKLSGTAAFISPEALQGGRLDQRSDLYSLGALAYFVFTGTVAHAVADSAALSRVWKKPVQPPSRVVSELPAEVDELVLSLLRVDPMQRPGSAAEVIDRLTAIAGLAPQADSASARRTLSSSPRMERGAYTERLHTHVRRTLAGNGSALLACAEAGMGRSRMLTEAASIAQTAGLNVVRAVARCPMRVGALASDLVQGLLQAAPTEARRALSVQPLAATSGSSGVPRLRALCAFVREIASARPLMICVDDLQNADELSGSLIAALAYHSRDCRLSIVASYDVQHDAPTLAQVPGLAESIWLGADHDPQPLAAQLQLSAQARALAELLCVSRAGASIARISELSQQSASTLLPALAELVQRGVIEIAGTQYVFAEDALRESLSDSLTKDRRCQLHASWAHCLLSGNPSDEEQHVAGWHLIHSGAELAGAEILVKVGSRWVERRVNMTLAVPALERALEIYTRHGRPSAQQLYLRSLLVISGCFVDQRLLESHAQATLDALFPFTGLARVERWPRVLGKPLAFVCAVLWTLLTWLAQPRQTRGPHVFDALRDYARAATALVGARALADDVSGAREAFARMRWFEGVAHPSLRLVHALARAFTQDRTDDSEKLLERVLKRLDPRRSAPLRMSEAERTDLLSGALMLKGIQACYSEHPDALSYVRRLERLETPLSAAAALRVSMRYYMLHGEPEAKDHFSRLLELSAVQHGIAGQSGESALSELIWSDPNTLRNEVDAFAKMLTHEPAFSSLLTTIDLGQHFRHRDHAAVVQAGEHYIQTHPAFSRIGWACAYAQIALSHLELGNTARALEICEYACPLLYDNHRQYIVHHCTLEAAYAVVLAAVGQRERAEDMFRMLIERLRAAGEHTRAFLLHEYRVKVLRRVGERQVARAVLKELCEAAAAAGIPRARPVPALVTIPNRKLLPLRAANQ